MAQITVEEFRNFFKYYNGEEHQQRAIEQLYDDLKKKTKDDKADWIVTYRTPSEVEEPAKKSEPGGICTPELMEQLTGYPASSFDDVFCNDCNRLFREMA